MEYKKRIEILSKLVEKRGLDGYLIEDSINILYLTGLLFSTAKLLVTKTGATLLVDGRYIEAASQLKFLKVILQGKESLPLAHKIGFAGDKVSYHRYVELNKSCEAVACEDLVLEMRMVKDKQEVQLLREAGELGSKGFDFVLTLLKEGVTETQVATELEIYWKKLGAQGLGFESIIGFGANSSKPHYRSGETRLQKGMTVLIDIGVKLNNYHSDMTRTLFFGKPDPKMGEIYEIVREAQKKALSLCKPGTKVASLDKAARDFIVERGFGEAFSHGLGHGVGLEIHELPVVKQIATSSQLPLTPGMVLTIEPGIYLPGLGGVRIEDTVVITEQGHENLTQRPTELLCI